MAKRGAGSGGLLLLGAIAVGIHSCISVLCGSSSGDVDRARREAEEERQRIAADRAAEQARQRRAEEEAKAKREAEAAERARMLAEAQGASASGRVKFVTNCYNDSAECDPPVDLVLEGAKTDGERKNLKRLVSQLEKQKEQRERTEARASAPLQCCDGMPSPSCTCGGPHRGCCSHHGGVCGCTE